MSVSLLSDPQITALSPVPSPGPTDKQITHIILRYRCRTHIRDYHYLSRNSEVHDMASCTMKESMTKSNPLSM